MKEGDQVVNEFGWPGTVIADLGDGFVLVRYANGFVGCLRRWSASGSTPSS